MKKELATAFCKTQETGEFHLSLCRRSIIGGYACDDKQLEKNPWLHVEVRAEILQLGEEGVFPSQEKAALLQCAVV